MKKKLVVAMVALFVLALSFAMSPKKANAIPAFAQKYHFSCAVCHTVFPNLNPFGRAFWRNGFRLPGTEGTPADATQITEGLSLPNPWPIPVMVEPIISYQHTTNENVSASTDAFGAGVDIVDAGAFKIYTPLADSISFYVHYGFSAGNGSSFTVGGNTYHSNNLNGKQIFASINGLGSGFGLAPHLFNLKLGQVTTASPYFYRQMPFYLIAGPVGNGQGLAVGGDGEAAALIHSRNAGFALYGTPGYHLWYKVTVTNDAGGNNATATGAGANIDGASNAMQYSYQLKEYAPIPTGQLEIGYYGSTIAEPMGASGANWTNRVTVNGVDVDLANDVYELGLTYMVQSDSNPYVNNGGALPYAGMTDSSNGYSTFEVFGRYILPVMNNGIMLSADYSQYSWTHKNTELAYANQGNSGVDNVGLYGGSSLPGVSYNGIKDALALQAEINLAYNAHLYLGYTITNQQEDNLLGTGLDFAF